MCLAIPAQIIEKTDDRKATVNILGVTRSVSLDLVPDATVDDWILVHAGFGIEVVNEADARETIDLINQMTFTAEETAYVPETFRDPLPEAVHD
ncbi:MAG: HypC/HybG/HupF family hydrogenase formation chaperone [Actinomycetia bacterium]|nr:HypC/HybG/HupF family hydrogenase formation chaperone [Actinomycetes bacterium]